MNVLDCHNTLKIHWLIKQEGERARAEYTHSYIIRVWSRSAFAQGKTLPALLRQIPKGLSTTRSKTSQRWDGPLKPSHLFFILLYVYYSLMLQSAWHQLHRLLQWATHVAHPPRHLCLHLGEFITQELHLLLPQMTKYVRKVSGIWWNATLSVGINPRYEV